jgi:RNA-binding protein
MTKLTGSQRKHLRGTAHGYQPVVQIGKEGLTDSVLGAIDSAMTARELIKVKVAADRDQRDALVRVVAERLDCECVGTIGRVAILYRQHPDPEKRRIVLPAPGGTGPRG